MRPLNAGIGNCLFSITFQTENPTAFKRAEFNSEKIVALINLISTFYCGKRFFDVSIKNHDFENQTVVKITTPIHHYSSPCTSRRQRYFYGIAYRQFATPVRMREENKPRGALKLLLLGVDRSRNAMWKIAKQKNNKPIELISTYSFWPCFFQNFL